MEQKEILFLKTGLNSFKNPAIARLLTHHFPECRVRVVDVLDDVLRSSPADRLLALGSAVWFYWREIVGQRRNPADFLCRTRMLQRRVRHWVRQQILPDRCAFIFQNQSLFNGHDERVPFFLYTDHTYRANFRYTDRSRSLRVPAWWPACEAAFYPPARRVFTTSRFARDSVIEDYGLPPDRVESVFSGANSGDDLPAPPTRPFHARILFVGIDWERKGGPDLLEAFRGVKAKIPGATLRIVGCSPRTDLPGVEVVGFVAPERLKDHYAVSDLFCLPTHRESAGIAFTEAALFGLPSIATNVGGVAERVIDGETGHLVPAGNPSALADRLTTLLADPGATRAMGAAAYRHAADTFTWTAVGRKIADSIRHALATGT